MTLHASFKFAVLLTTSCLFASVGFAQQEEDADTEDTAPVQAPVQDALPLVEEVVVTGSRLRRDTYSSISPLQVITGQGLPRDRADRPGVNSAGIDNRRRRAG